MEEDGSFPDLVVVDGGKGQLSMAVSALRELGLDYIPTISLAKKLEEVFVPGQSSAQTIHKQSPGLILLRRIRDEAHRFAISGHRQRRDKKRHTSLLQGIPGVGPSRRRDLIKYFGGAREVGKASISDLMKVPNINKKVAEAIYAALYKD